MTLQPFLIPAISSTTTHARFKCRVMFAQCSGNSVINSCTVCITLLNSEDVPWMRSISISQILVLPDITDVKMLNVLQFLLCPRQFPHFTTVSPTPQAFSTTLIAPPTVIISDPTESWSRNRSHDRRIAPKVAAVASHFFPKSCVGCILRENLLFLFCFSYIAWYSRE